MTLPIKSGIAVGFFPNNTTSNPPNANDANWIYLTDHNRQPFDIGYDNIEKDIRMANGFMRKYVVAQKRTISANWDMIPSVASVQSIIKYGNPGGTGDYTASAVVSNLTVDGLPGAAWIRQFYEKNIFIPIWIKVTHSTASATGTYAAGFSPTEVYTSQMNSASHFKYPLVLGNTASYDGNPQPDIYYGYMTDFSYSVQKRFSYTDYVNLSIKFVEA